MNNYFFLKLFDNPYFRKIDTTHFNWLDYCVLMQKKPLNMAWLSIEELNRAVGMLQTGMLIRQVRWTL